ncbi:MAG: UbiX family flavin prenyltransferase [Candidatus Diapherotrites archaeon]|nr:UbiX family flavin prenyltransferase [Candidatus Diapherotrites archaeon]
MKKKIIVGITGASGIEYAIEFLKGLKERKEIETHLIISEAAKKVLEIETEFKSKDLEKLVDFVYDNKNMAASVSSSSFKIDSMIVIPASVKTCSAIANAYTDELIVRCADNMLKFKKKLVVCIRETPLSSACLKNLHELSLMGAVVMPLSPGFYLNPKSKKDLIFFMIGKCLDSLEIDNDFKRWK